MQLNKHEVRRDSTAAARPAGGHVCLQARVGTATRLTATVLYIQNNGSTARGPMTSLYGDHDYYRKMLALHEKLRKSEEERVRLEERFKVLVEESRNRHDACINRLRSRFIEFLEEQNDRYERNEVIMKTLDRIDHDLASMTIKTQRLAPKGRSLELADRRFEAETVVRNDDRRKEGPKRVPNTQDARSPLIFQEWASSNLPESSITNAEQLHRRNTEGTVPGVLEKGQTSISSLPESNIANPRQFCTRNIEGIPSNVPGILKKYRESVPSLPTTYIPRFRPKNVEEFTQGLGLNVPGLGEGDQRGVSKIPELYIRNERGLYRKYIEGATSNVPGSLKEDQRPVSSLPESYTTNIQRSRDKDVEGPVGFARQLTSNVPGLVGRGQNPVSTDPERIYARNVSGSFGNDRSLIVTGPRRLYPGLNVPVSFGNDETLTLAHPRGLRTTNIEETSLDVPGSFRNDRSSIVKTHPKGLYPEETGLNVPLSFGNDETLTLAHRRGLRTTNIEETSLDVPGSFRNDRSSIVKTHPKGFYPEETGLNVSVSFRNSIMTRPKRLHTRNPEETGLNVSVPFRNDPDSITTHPKGLNTTNTDRSISYNQKPSLTLVDPPFLSNNRVYSSGSYQPRGFALSTTRRETYDSESTVLRLLDTNRFSSPRFEGNSSRFNTTRFDNSPTRTVVKGTGDSNLFSSTYGSGLRTAENLGDCIKRIRWLHFGDEGSLKGNLEENVEGESVRSVEERELSHRDDSMRRTEDQRFSEKNDTMGRTEDQRFSERNESMGHTEEQRFSERNDTMERTDEQNSLRMDDIKRASVEDKGELRDTRGRGDDKGERFRDEERCQVTDESEGYVDDNEDREGIERRYDEGLSSSRDGSNEERIEGYDDRNGQRDGRIEGDQIEIKNGDYDVNKDGQIENGNGQRDDGIGSEEYGGDDRVEGQNGGYRVDGEGIVNRIENGNGQLETDDYLRGSQIETQDNETGGQLETDDYQRGSQLETQGYQTGDQIETDDYQRGSQLETEDYQRGSQIETQDYQRGSQIETQDYQEGSQIETKDYQGDSQIETQDYQRGSQLLTNDYQTGSQIETQDYQTGSQIETQDYQRGSQIETQDYQRGSQLETDDYYGGSQIEADDYQGGSQLETDDSQRGSQIETQDYQRGSQLETDDYQRGSQLETQDYQRGSQIETQDYQRGSQLETQDYQTGGQLETDDYQRGSQLETNNYQGGSQLETDDYQRGSQIENTNEEGTINQNEQIPHTTDDYSINTENPNEMPDNQEGDYQKYEDQTETREYQGINQFETENLESPQKESPNEIPDTNSEYPMNDENYVNQNVETNLTGNQSNVENENSINIEDDVNKSLVYGESNAEGYEQYNYENEPGYDYQEAGYSGEAYYEEVEKNEGVVSDTRDEPVDSEDVGRRRNRILLDSDTESAIERNVSNAESDFDFN